MPHFGHLWEDLEIHLKSEAEKRKKLENDMFPLVDLSKGGGISYGMSHNNNSRRSSSIIDEQLAFIEKLKEEKKKEQELFDLYGCRGAYCNGECLNMKCQPAKLPSYYKNQKYDLYREDLSFSLRLKIAFWGFLAKFFR